MKATITKMWVAMRNYVKLLIVIFIIFQIIAVIVTIENSSAITYTPSPMLFFKQQHDEKNNSVSIGKNSDGKSSSPFTAFKNNLKQQERNEFRHDFENYNISATSKTDDSESQVTSRSGIEIENKRHSPPTTDTSHEAKEENATAYESFPKKVVSHLLDMLDFNSQDIESTTQKISNKTVQNPTIENDNAFQKEDYTGSSIIQSDISEPNRIFTTDVNVFRNEEHLTEFGYEQREPIREIENSNMVLSTEQTINRPQDSEWKLDKYDFMESSAELPAPEKKRKKEKTDTSRSLLHTIIGTFSRLYHANEDESPAPSTTEDVNHIEELIKLKEESFTFSEEYDTEKMIRSAGYPVETHKVVTADGYILTVHRIPASVSVARPARRTWLPVYLQHGLWSSSYHWVEIKPQYALPLILSDAGYDVWLGNSRGNVISREHVNLSTSSDSSFWDFSFHEMGLYDLPATIEHILRVTEKPQLHYIGHSMGTTMFFVMASLLPEVAQKVHFMLALAPIATVGPIRSFFRWMLLLERYLLTRQKPVALLSSNGISLKTVLHYMQLYVTGKFSMYDYGRIANMDIYKSPFPPTYDLTTISLPIVLCYGTKDPFLRLEDLQTLQSALGNSLGLWPVPLTHFQFPGGKASKKFLYSFIPLHLH